MKYTGENLREISFPLGGIGTGSIGLSGSGRLIDWEIFNRPSKGSIHSYSHIAVKAQNENGVFAKILNGDTYKDYMGTDNDFGNGIACATMAGYPHFDNCEFDGEFPIANIAFSDKNFPASVKLTAFNPFIPGDDKNSSIPAAFFTVELTNNTDTETKYSALFTVANPNELSSNRKFCENGVTGIRLTDGQMTQDNINYKELSIATNSSGAIAQEYWYRGMWHDGLIMYCNELLSDNDFKERSYEIADCSGDCCTLCVVKTLKPKESVKINFVLSWYAPNCNCYWSHNSNVIENDKVEWKNYYASIFENSADAAQYSLKHFDEFFNKTLTFKNALFSATMDEKVIEAVSSNLSVLKSPTVLRLEDGTFYGWEGVFKNCGSCFGTCQHVWNYAYALCFLFPNLERSIRNAEFRYATDENGKTSFRITLPLGTEMLPDRACADGQMGTVIKSFREWKISGNDEWLKENWSKIKSILEYAWSDKNYDKWDPSKTGVLTGRQHHTLDKELFGPCSWTEGMYLAALKAASIMAEYLGEQEKAEEYLNIYENGREWTKNNLFNGEYFIQKIDLSDKSIIEKFDAVNDYWNEETKEIKYQIRNGCEIDQILAQ